MMFKEGHTERAQMKEEAPLIPDYRVRDLVGFFMPLKIHQGMGGLFG